MTSYTNAKVRHVTHPLMTSFEYFYTVIIFVYDVYTLNGSVDFVASFDLVYIFCHQKFFDLYSLPFCH